MYVDNPRFALFACIDCFVILGELVERRQFFAKITFNSDLEEKVMNGERDSIENDILPEYEKLLRWCWHQDPNERPVRKPKQNPPLPHSTYC